MKFPLFVALLLGFVFPVFSQSPKTDPLTAVPVDTFAVPSASTLLTREKLKKLFDALDLSDAALSPVREARAKGDARAAIHALAEYYRNRSNVPWIYDPHHPKRNPVYKNKVADDAAKGIVSPAGLRLQYAFPGNKIDWHLNATLVEPGVPHNMEWPAQLCRMPFWNDLAAAYQATGDEKYASAWIIQLRSFLAQNPMPAQLAGGFSPWSRLQCGVRMSGSWPNAFYGFLLSPSFTDEDLCLYLGECLDEAHYLDKYHCEANWEIFRLQAIFTIGALYPEFKEARHWRTYAIAAMKAQISSQFLPDGVHYELAPGYGMGCLTSILGLAKMARSLGRADEIPDDYTGPMEKAYEYVLYFMTPDRHLPAFNDSWGGSARGLLKDALNWFPNHPDFQWVVTDGKEGHPPAETSHAFSWAGFYCMRSGWDRDANYGILRAGPCYGWHSHQDKLAFVLWPYGRQLLFTSGGPSYEQSKWRDYYQNTFSANCVLVDGLPQFRPVGGHPLPKIPLTSDVSAGSQGSGWSKIDARWESTPDHDFAAGVYDEGYGKQDNHIATQTRRVLFLKPDLFIVADTLVPNDGSTHTYQARWHLCTTNSKLDPGTGVLVTTDAGLPNLAIVPVDTKGLKTRSVSAMTEPEVLGWNVSFTAAVTHQPATTLLHTRQGQGVQSFLTLFVPIKAGGINPFASVKELRPGTAIVTLTDGRVLTIDIDSDPSGGIQVNEKLPDGTWGRRVKVSGRSKCYTMALQ